MNIRLDSTGHSVLYVGDKCPYCGRALPEKGTCKCGVWARRPVDSPTYLIELTANHRELVDKAGHWSEQYKQAKEENGGVVQ
jgi:hypothetical protein